VAVSGLGLVGGGDDNQVDLLTNQVEPPGL
jgi:hypothetical protein